jgi:hypothetical protein
MAPEFFRGPDDAPMAREEDGTERLATPREVLDHFQGDEHRRWPAGPEDANEAAARIVKKATEGK